jgi:hypothetical protein
VIRTALLAAALASTATVADAKPIAPGIYSSVRMSADTGDLGGAELELRGTGADAHVAFVLCEGWCNAVIEAPVTVTARGFIFPYSEPLKDEAGRPVSGPRYFAEAVPAGSGLRLTLRPADPGGDPLTFRLKRQSEPFGLAVARGD